MEVKWCLCGITQLFLPVFGPYGNAAQALNLHNKEITDNMSSVNSQLGGNTALQT